jgi:hypothetical protein
MNSVYKPIDNDSFIAFKLPTAIKNQLQRMADSEDISLSQLLRRNCMALTGHSKPATRSVGRKFQKEPPRGSWLWFRH